MPFSVRLCSGRTAFEVTTNFKMDLMNVCKILNTKVATKHIVLLNYDGVDISMYPSGRMIIKASCEEESLKIAENLLKDLGFIEY
ncbi:MAG: hypothetical protein J5U19_10170 [Candidatus Methanoperedens sp.]|nr:hypothetical protein [Candidatus Methanoperedens sp.]MCE8428742.1 hypothetical protein [Candidatus Methanoperedens sp.]